MHALPRFIAIAGLVATTGFHSAFAVDETLEKLPYVKKLQLANAGDNDAKLAVGEALESGMGTSVNLARAAQWYRQAALGGNLEAQFRLARLIAKGAKGVPVDKASAIKLLQSAAAHDHAESENLLGTMLQNGDGIAKDEKAAVSWYEKAAAQGLAVAQNNLGVMYLKGSGTDRDLAKAFALFEKASIQGEGWALNNLGGMYEMGWGTTRDISKAKQFYAKAAEKGIAIAKKNVDRLALSN
jgi:TPR repeat protein